MTFPERYNRQINLPGFGMEAQRKLQLSRILVVGAGGLGLPALQYLAAMGVGTIGIVDGDIVNASNLNRQILFYESEVGMPKALVARDKLTRQNPGINILVFNEFLAVTNALDIISHFDLVIDATDNFGARYLVNDACVMLAKPFIYGAIQQYEGHVSVFNHADGPTYRCLYPEFPSAGESRDCNTGGVLGVVPGIIGCQQALEAVKLVTGVGKTASGVLRIFDFYNNDQYEVKLKARAINKGICQLQESYEPPNCAVIPFIGVQDLHQWLHNNKEFLLLDVREKQEYDELHLEKSQLLPLSELEGNSVQLPPDIPVVAVCQKGSRSIKAATILQETDKDLAVYWLEGGMERWLKEMGNKMVVS